MVRKFIVSVFLFVFFTGVSLFAQSETMQKNSNDIQEFEKRFKLIDESMDYLKNKSIDSNDILTLYTESESLFREIKYSSELKDYNMAVKFLSHKLTILEEKAIERVSLAKRMDLMYIIMAGMGIMIIILMSSISIYMYSRRK